MHTGDKLECMDCARKRKELSDYKDREPEDYPVGQGPLYEPFRELAKSLLPLFVSGKTTFNSWWGLGSDFGACDFVDTHCKLYVNAHSLWGWEKKGTGFAKVYSSQDLRVLGIGLLILAEDMERKEGNLD